MMKRRVLAGVVVLAVAAVVVWLVVWPKTGTSRIRFGMSPYQDTAMPKVAEGMGLYKARGLDVELVTVAWEDIVPSLASAGRTIDIGIGSINLLLPKAENINVKGGADVVFYYPLYVFKGAALMMRGSSGMRPLPDLVQKYPDDRARAIREATQQLRGKRIGLPEGTPYEQMLLAALKTAGLDPKRDVVLRHVQLADALPAFLAGDLDVVGAGVTQRVEAIRHGHKVFMDQESFGFAEVVGIVTTKRFAESHPHELRRLIGVWFESVDALLSDTDTHSKYVLEYLAKNSSTKYSLQEYKQALAYQEFPRSVEEANALLLRADGKFHWKRTWDIVNDYLMNKEGEGRIEKPIPYDWFLGDKVGKGM